MLADAVALFPSGSHSLRIGGAPSTRPPTPPGNSALTKGTTGAGERYVSALATVRITDNGVNTTVAQAITVGQRGRDRAEAVLKSFQSKAAAILPSANTPEGLQLLTSTSHQHLDAMSTIIDDTKTANAALAAKLDEYTADYRGAAPQAPGVPTPDAPTDDTIDDPQRRGGIQPADFVTGPGADPPLKPPPPLSPPQDVGSQERPGVTDVNDPGVEWQPGFDPNSWKGSWHNPMLADNPPGYTGGPGPARDAAWQDYLAHFPTGQRGFLPNPAAVNDPGLKVLGNAATQLGTSYAWDGKGLNGPGRGSLKFDTDGAAHRYHDDQRIGFDCSGLAEYSAWQTAHTDIGAGTGTQIDSPNLTNIPVGAPLKPGDLIYYGPGGAHHVGIYVAPDVILNAPQSGLPVQVQQRPTTVGSDPTDGIIRARRLP